MIGTILCAATLALGVQYGWEPNGEGGLEYIVQLDEESIQNLGRGIPFRSDFPRDLQGIETIRFQVGDKRPPKIALPLPAIPPTIEKQKPAELADNPGGKPLEAQKAVFEESNKADEKKNVPAAAEKSITVEDEKPWPLLYTALGTATGLTAAFFYLLWLHVDMRVKYRMLLAEQIVLGRETWQTE